QSGAEAPQSKAESKPCVWYSEPVEASPMVQHQDLAILTQDILGGKVDTLLIMGGNPAFTAPNDIPFAQALRSPYLKNRYHFGVYDDETAALCEWHLPESHFLESWGDIRTYDGTTTIIQ